MAEGKAFEFRLETLLNYRKRLLDLRAQQLAEAHRAVNAAAARCEQLHVERTASREAISKPDADGRLDVDASRALDWHIQYLAQAISRQEDEVERLADETEARRVDAVDASKRKKVVERLRIRDLAAFLDDLARDERKFLDEVGAVRAARSRSANPGGYSDGVQHGGAVIQ